MINLSDLGNLSTKELVTIKENVENYYKDFSPSQQSKISILISIVIRDGFPQQFKLDEVNIEILNETLGFVNSYRQICFEDNDNLVCMPIFYKVNAETFKENFIKVRDAHSIENRWRVDNSYSEDDYRLADNYMTEDGSTISIKDEDIISVCSMIGGVTRGRDLLKHAVQSGGKKLDAYQNLFGFYVKSGFMPISYCKWDDEYAPDDWKSANNFTDDTWKSMPDTNFNVKREDIIFYIYTGDTEGIPKSFDEWKQRVECSEDYDTAKVKRDKLLNELGGKE